MSRFIIFFELYRGILTSHKWSRLVTCCRVSVICPWRYRNVNSPVAGIRIKVAVLTAVSLLSLKLEAPVNVKNYWKHNKKTQLWRCKETRKQDTSGMRLIISRYTYELWLFETKLKTEHGLASLSYPAIFTKGLSCFIELWLLETTLTTEHDLSYIISQHPIMPWCSFFALAFSVTLFC